MDAEKVIKAKVIKALECCSMSSYPACQECPYHELYSNSGCINKRNADIENLINMYIDLYKAGVQDFADKLTDRIADAMDRSHDNPNGSNYDLADVFDTIHNLVKELTEGKDDEN